MKLKVQIEREGAEAKTLLVSPLAFIYWERISGRKMSDLSSGGLGMLDLAQLTMEQERLQGAEVPETVEEYLAGVDDLTPVSDDPTQSVEVPSGAP